MISGSSRWMGALMTPLSADGYLCPMGRSNDSDDWCMGPKCAAWCWVDELRHRVIVHVEDPMRAELTEPVRPDRVPESYVWTPYEECEGDPACWVEPHDQAEERRIGRCGMVNGMVNG